MSMMRRLWSSRWLRWIVSGALLAVVISYVDLGKTLQIVRAGRPDLILITFALSMAIRLLAAYRWWVLLRCGNATITFGEVTRITFLSVFLGTFMPGSVGLEAIRIYGAKQATSDLALSFSSVLVERALALFALVSLVIVGLIAAPPGLPPMLGRWAWLGLVLLALATLILMHPRLRMLTGGLASKRRWLAPIRERLFKLYARLDMFAERPALMAWLLLLAFGFQLLRVLATAIGAWALGVDLPLTTFVVLVPMIVLISLAPITIAGLGVREAAYVFLFGLVGVNPEIAFALSIMMYLLTLLTSLPGAFYLARYRAVRLPDPERAADPGP